MVRHRTDSGGSRAFLCDSQAYPYANKLAQISSGKAFVSLAPPGSPMNQIVLDDLTTSDVCKVDDSRHLMDEPREGPTAPEEELRGEPEERDSGNCDGLTSGNVIDLTNREDIVEPTNIIDKNEPHASEGPTTSSWFSSELIAAGNSIGEVISSFTVKQESGQQESDTQQEADTPRLLCEEYSAEDPSKKTDEKEDQQKVAIPSLISKHLTADISVNKTDEEKQPHEMPPLVTDKTIEIPCNVESILEPEPHDEVTMPILVSDEFNEIMKDEIEDPDDNTTKEDDLTEAVSIECEMVDVEVNDDAIFSIHGEQGSTKEEEIIIVHDFIQHERHDAKEEKEEDDKPCAPITSDSVEKNDGVDENETNTEYPIEQNSMEPQRDDKEKTIIISKSSLTNSLTSLKPLGEIMIIQSIHDTGVHEREGKEEKQEEVLTVENPENKNLQSAVQEADESVHMDNVKIEDPTADDFYAGCNASAFLQIFNCFEPSPETTAQESRQDIPIHDIHVENKQRSDDVGLNQIYCEKETSTDKAQLPYSIDQGNTEDTIKKTPAPIQSFLEQGVDVTRDAEVGCDEKIFDNSDDLQSIPSVEEDVNDTVSPYQASDFGVSPKVDSTTLIESNIKRIDEKIVTSSLPQVANQQHEGASVKSYCSSFCSKLNLKKSLSLKSKQSGTASSRRLDAHLDIKSTEDESNDTLKDGEHYVDGRRAMLDQELKSAIATYGKYDIRCANISAALGDLLAEFLQFDHAIKLHRDSVTIYSCKLGDDHSTTMSAKEQLATVLESAGEVEEAISIFYQVMCMRRALLGDQDPSVADGLVSIAHALRKNGDYEQAIKELKRALKLFRESLGDSHGKVASTVDEIASLYVTIGDFTKSSAILEEVVKLKAATVGAKSKPVADTLIQLANSYECSEKFDNAMKSLKKAYKVYTEILGYSSEEASNTLNRMAQLYEATKDYNRAAIAYLGVLRGRKIQRGADHISVGETYYHLARSLRETKQYEKALKCLKESLPIFIGQGVEMNDIKMVADIMHEMALVSLDRGHFQDAARILKQELGVRRKMGQPDFPFSARTLKFLGVTEYTMKNYSRSLKYLVEALAIHQEREDQGIECGEVLFHTGLVFYKVNNKERAVEAFGEAARIFSNHALEDNHMYTEAKEKIDLIRTEIDSANRANAQRFYLTRRFGDSKQEK